MHDEQLFAGLSKKGLLSTEASKYSSYSSTRIYIVETEAFSAECSLCWQIFLKNSIYTCIRIFCINILQHNTIETFPLTIISKEKTLFFLFFAENRTNYIVLANAHIMHCKENPIYVFLFWELRSLGLIVHIHVSVWAIYIFPGSVHIRIGRSIMVMYKYLTESQTHECGNWDCGRAIPFLGIFVSKFRYWFLAVSHDTLLSCCFYLKQHQLCRRLL